MPEKYLHNHKDFDSLIKIIAEERSIDIALVEKDYWIMHVLYGLKEQGFQFELKGGTSLSKGYKLIDRFSEDIDIHIKPLESFEINENPRNDKPNNVEKKKKFYDWLSHEIKIPGIVLVERDTNFDETGNYNSGGIRLSYESKFTKIEGLKEGILLESGFDTITPNIPRLISSWAYDTALKKEIKIIDNRAHDIICYHPGYTFVEKLQAIATKYRNEMEKGSKGNNFMRQYYDVYCLLKSEEIHKFIGTEEYQKHKQNRFPQKDFDIPINENEAFLLSSQEVRSDFIRRYQATSGLYYQGQPDFNEIISFIATYIDKL